MAKNTNTLLIVGAVAVVGYLAFRKGGILNKTPAAVPGTVNPNLAIPASTPAQSITSLISSIVADFNPQPAASSPQGVALEQPTPATINVIAPVVDPTGMQLTFLN